MLPQVYIFQVNFNFMNINKINKRGQLFDLSTTVIAGIFVLLLAIFAMFLGISSLNPGSFFTAGSSSQNATNDMISNLTKGTGNFFSQIPVGMTILGVVLILGFLALLIVVVLRFKYISTEAGNI